MQAILITCYKDKENLIRLIKSFEDKMSIYVHIDKKTTEINEKDLKLLNYKNLYFIKKYPISWGSYNHLLAIIDLIKLAVKNNNNYIHIISGQDYKIKELEYFNKFNNSKKIYISLTSYNDMPDNIKKRYKKGTFNSKFSTKIKWVRILNKIYGFFRNKNNIGEFTKIYKGMIWGSMPMETAQYILEYINNKKNFLKDLKHCIIPEEFFLQTILMNSRYASDVFPNNLRYTDWNKRNGCCPAYLDETDFEKIYKNEYIFARKIDTEISKKLIKLIDNKISIERSK